MSTKRYFACPYCNKRLTRESLVGHLERNHLEELPEGFSPLRMTFHVVNKKPITYQRPCRICKKPTKWDEKKGRYDFLCGDPNCKAQWVKQMKDVMGDKYGAYRPTASIEGLEKMLNSRKISGKYKWSDGTEKTFTGSYEKEALKFMDLVLDIKSEELMVPGPVQKYTLDGKEHYYIPDMYYIPYNLIIEVKDGGERPNKNQAYKGTRTRQRAKEEYIINKTDYNYLRLTDNDFSQLLAIFADLKMHLIDHDTSKTVHVNETTEVLENMFAGIQGMMPTSSTFDNNDVVIVNYLQNNAFTGSDINKYAVAINPKFDTIFFRDKDGKLKLGNRKSIGENYTTYIVKNKADIIPYIESKVNSLVDKDFIYESVFNHIPVTDDQIKFENAIEYLDFYKEMSTIEESVSKYIEEAAYKDLSFANPETKDEDEDTNTITESFVFNEKDIYWNKDKFDSGEINLCFIIGHRGSGKSTMVHKTEKDNVEVYELDDLVWNKMSYTMENFKEYGDMFYSYFSGQGKKFYYTPEEVEKGLVKSVGDEYEKLLINDFMSYAIKYANSHKDKKFIVEGIWLVDFFEPKDFKDYAVYIKGTSLLVSRWRAVKRDSQGASEGKRAIDRFNNFFSWSSWKPDADFEKNLKKWRDYYTKLQSSVRESNIEQVENSPSPDHYSALDIEDRFYVKATDGSTNCVLKIAGYENYMRGRSSILIFLTIDNKLCVLLKPNKDGTYSAPGGGWDINEHPMDAAIREAREEVHMNVSNVEEAGVLIEYSDYVQDWVREHVKDQSVWWYGYYSVIFTAEYESMYNGYVASEDQDPDFENNSDFYPINELDYSKMPVEYAMAIKSYAEKKGGN